MATFQLYDGSQIFMNVKWLEIRCKTGWWLRVSGICSSSPQKVGFPEKVEIHLEWTILPFTKSPTKTLIAFDWGTKLHEKDNHLPQICKKRETWFQLAFSKSNSHSIIPNSHSKMTLHDLRWVNSCPNIDGIWSKPSPAWDSSYRCDVSCHWEWIWTSNECIEHIELY